MDVVKFYNLVICGVSKTMDQPFALVTVEPHPVHKVKVTL